MPEQTTHRTQQLWYSGSSWHLLLAPCSALFALVTTIRRWLYRRGVLRSTRVSVPVIVVGNISVGGTGKTPVTIWLAEQLKRRGLRPGVVSRGYGGVVGKQPVQANANSEPAIVGDEPLLIARRSKVPVVVHPNRVAAAQELIKIGVDVIIADDGLQHYRLQRDYEIAVIDAARGLGNGWLLPAGPLREPKSRLQSVDRILLHQASMSPQHPAGTEFFAERSSSFHLVNHEVVRLDASETASFDAFRGKTVHAVAAIGNPERFFAALEQRGLTLIRHPFPDHAQLSARDLAYDDQFEIIMTEKDAVKCREFANARQWYVPVDVAMHDDSWLDGLEQKIRQTKG
ncbi:MAG: tetraacyldisaccharide 4'-kinase [Woeseia sp.]